MTLYDFDHHDIENSRPPRMAAPRRIGETADDDLMEWIQRRDERALETLIKHYRPLLRGIVARQIANDHDVTDVVKEVFLGVWNQSAKFDTSKGKLIIWIITIGRRRAIDRVRRRQAYDRAVVGLSVHRETEDGRFAGDKVEKTAMGLETAAKFQELLSSLPKPQSAIVRMAYDRGLSHREMARETSVPLGTTKTRRKLGVKKLRKAVAQCPIYFAGNHRLAHIRVGFERRSAALIGASFR
jgi:RNA polymerase sigma-70 factor (ECF subfamily)